MKQIVCIVTVLLLLSIVPVCLCDSGLVPGQLIYFGSYEQDMSLENGKENILWRVLDVDKENNAAFLMSEFALDCVIYNDTTQKTAWGDSYIRNWLQDIFYVEAFNSLEKKTILPANASESIDYVFLLSADELTCYLDDFCCVPTGLAMTNGVFKTSKTGKLTCSYWVREDSTTTYGVFVGALGGIRENYNKVTMDDNGVRPAIFLSLDYDKDTPGAKLSDFHLYERVTIPNLGTIQITGQKVQNKLGYYPAGRTGTVESDFEKYYDSGSDAVYIILQANITNRNNYSYLFSPNVSIMVEYNDEMKFKGWCYQYNHNNGFSTKVYANGGDYAKQNLNYVISQEDEFAIVPEDTGYFCFGCTLPSEVAYGDGFLRMIISINGHDITFNILK